MSESMLIFLGGTGIGVISSAVVVAFAAGRLKGSVDALAKELAAIAKSVEVLAQKQSVQVDRLHERIDGTRDEIQVVSERVTRLEGACR